MNVLEGKRALVVGAAGGIGGAIARAFAAAGATLVIADSAVDRLSEVAEECCAGRGGIAEPAFVDLRSEESVRALAKRAGHIDILVNSAGVLHEAPLAQITLDDFDRMTQVGLRGVFLTCREIAPAMAARGSGRIINIASQLGIKGGTHLCHYAAAKAGVIGLTKSLALELAPCGVLVNAIAPGPIETAMTASITGQWRADKLKQLPLGRFGRPEEVAPTAVLLASDPGGNLYVGQTLGPNCGDVMP